MRLMPRSLFGRLLGTAIVMVAAALLFAGFAISGVLEHIVLRNLDERLDAQIAVVARAVRVDGSLDPAKAIDLPPFDQRASGWAWEVRAPIATSRSASLGPNESIVPPVSPPRPPRPPASPGSHPPAPPPPNHGEGTQPRPFDGLDAAGKAIHGRVVTIPTARGDATVAAVGPRALVERPLRAAMAPFLVSLLLLGAALAVAILIQLRFGLRPLGRIRLMLAEVRAGRRDHVDAREPTELLPLIEELNGLIAANRTALAQARGHVANLAHGLKTPLAALRLDVEAEGDARVLRHVDRIDAQIRHHLGRARAASMGDSGAEAAMLAPHVADLVGALHRIHADRALAVDVAIPETLAVRCDPQDLDEMVGNLLDNGFRWARSRIRIDGAAQGRTIALRIADDGPGIDPALLAAALEPGRRLDEQGDGHGFGLPIARELAELHGGSLALANSGTGGLIATLHLPAAIS